MDEDGANRPWLALYTTSGCHLCERAQRLIHDAIKLPLRLVEIADDEALAERYGVRIPVLRRLDDGQELDWPFDATAVQHFVRARREGPERAFF